jgi:nitrite reductase (NADH) small subunit
MPFVRVAALADVPVGEVRQVESSGIAIAVGNREGQVFAIGGVCPHVKGPLGQGSLNGDWVTCPWHLWEFHCETGCSSHNESACVPVYEARVESGEILVNLPSA